MLLSSRCGLTWALLAFASGAASACRSASGGSGAGASGEARVVRRAVEDVFLLSGELRAVRSEAVVVPRSDDGLQIRWMVEDGSEVRKGDRIVEFDSARLLQRIEEQRLRFRQAENERESRERVLLAEADRKRVAVEKAEIEAEKARIDAEVPRELRAAVEWRRMQGAYQEKRAALEKARLDREAFRTSSRSDLEVLRRSEEKAKRELAIAEGSVAAMSAFAPTDGIFLAANFPYEWGPEGPRKLHPGDTLFPGVSVASIPDPSAMEVAATLAEVDYGAIRSGLKARCILDTYPGRVFEGRIEDVGAVAGEANRSFGMQGARAGFPVRVSLARTDPLMRPGLSVRVEVVRAAWPNALTVPRQAVRFDKGRPVLAKAGSTAPAGVAITACTPVDCVIESGLQEGDRVFY
jgi:multidrug efflux pump subunit AcrA (membrane-fusion protein)